MDPRPLLPLVRPGDDGALLVVAPDRHRRCPEDRSYALTDEFAYVVEVELLGKCRTDLVDDRQFGGALVGFGKEALRLAEQASILQRHAHARCQRREQAFVAFTERVWLGALETDDADDAFAGLDGHAQPRLGVSAADLDRAASELLVEGGQAQR